ncbi:MAG: hypothetical protein ACYDEJ_03420 [Desulfitobacteriaceae bacterium]
MLKQLRKLTLKSDWFRKAVADYQRRAKEQQRQEHIAYMIFRGGMMRL